MITLQLPIPNKKGAILTNFGWRLEDTYTVSNCLLPSVKDTGGGSSEIDLKVYFRSINLKHLNNLPNAISLFESRLNMIENPLCIDSVRKFIISSANAFYRQRFLSINL